MRRFSGGNREILCSVAAYRSFLDNPLVDVSIGGCRGCGKAGPRDWQTAGTIPNEVTMQSRVKHEVYRVGTARPTQTSLDMAVGRGPCGVFGG